MRSLTRLVAFSFLGATAAFATACNGELYLNSEESLTDFDDADRDHGGDPIDNGDDGTGGDGTDSGDIDGDSLLGDGFGGDGGDDDCPECCGFGGVCPAGQQCYTGVCGPACGSALCGSAQLCCSGATSECCDATVDATCGTDHCRKACPNGTDIHCGAQDELCCDGAGGFTCGEDLTCVTACGTTDGPLCGADITHAGVCCDGKGTADPNDDDVCLFSQCVPRGGSCTTFVDCLNGQYCETEIHNPGDPTHGVCLPNDFPDGTPTCQSGSASNIFTPKTEWAWVGIQLVTDANPWSEGDLVRPCANTADTHCYREPCTNFGDGNLCFRSVESIPTTADMDNDGFPEVAFKAYADATFDNAVPIATPTNNGNLLVVIDGRSDGALPVSNDPTQVSSTHHTKRVIFGETRGHMAIGDIDGDAKLEIVAAHNPGVRAYDPFKLGNPTGTNTANVMVWATEAGDANNKYTGGAPSLNDMNNDGVPEVVIGAVVLDATTGATLTSLSSTVIVGTSQGGQCGNNTGQDCFSITTVADVNGDELPELLTGDRAFAVANGGALANGGTWTETLVWTAHHDALATGGCGDTHSVNCAQETDAARPLGAGFPGVGNFVDNSKPPYCGGTTGISCATAVDLPEVATVYNGSVFIVSGKDGTLLRTPTPCTPSVVATPNAACLAIFDKAACIGTSGCQWDNAELYTQPLANKGGPPNIADFDGDGHVEVSFAGTGCMVVVDPQCFVGSQNANARDAMPKITGSGCSLPRPTGADPAARTCSIGVGPAIGNEYGLSWMFQTQDASSAVTGTSVFDFQGDLKAEVLYNDECFFRVFEGSDASILYERPNSHRTATEYPIVVDVDGDNNSEIVVVSTGDQAVGRDRCGNGNRAGHAECDGKNTAQCNADANCRLVNATCIPTTAFLESSCSSAPTACNGHTNAQCNAIPNNNSNACTNNNWCSYDGNRAAGQRCFLDTTKCCNTTDGCQNVSGTCAPYAYYRDATTKYKGNACFCTDHTTQADCNAGRGCAWDSGNNVCALVGAAGTYCSVETTVAGCSAKSKDCIWDPYQGTGVCEQHPRDQDYICSHATWGVTSFGDTSDSWVRTLPYWHEHDYHITNRDRAGDPVPDFFVCYDNQADGDVSEATACRAITDKTTCNANADCAWGDRNTDFFNNFRQNVPGQVPLNAADLQVTALVADLRSCPPTITLIATIKNTGRSGAPAGVPVGFYRMKTSETVQVTAARTDELGGAYVLTPTPLLPGQSVHVEVTFTLPGDDVPINLAYRAIANPPFVVNSSGEFECNANNNSSDISNVDCINTGS